MKFIFKWMFFLLGITLFNAQNTYTVSGTVNDFHDKTVLKDAKITIGNKSTTSDYQGKFSLKNIPEGNYEIIATHPDCEPFSELIKVERNLDITINLEHHAHDIETVTLHGKHKTAGTIIVKTLDEKTIARNSTENLGNILQKISGVGTLKTGNNIAKPVIHGMYGSRISIINNGVKMAEQEWGVEHAPNVDINNFEHIDVIKGASALKYGSESIGGVIVLEPEISPKQDTLKGSVGVSGISNGRGIGADINLLKSWENGWMVKTGGTYRKLGDLQTPDYLLMNTGMNFNSFNFTLQNVSFKKGISFDYSLTNQEIGIFRGSHTGNLEDFNRAMTASKPIYMRDFSYTIDNPRQEIEHHIARISAFNRFRDFGKLSANYSFQFNHRKEFDLRRGELDQIPSLDLELITNQLNLNHLLERGRFNLETGIDLMYQNNFSDPATKARRLIPNYDKYLTGIYSVYKRKLSNQWNFEAGARYDYNFYNVAKWYDSKDWESLYTADFPQFYMETVSNRVLTNPKLRFNNFSFNAGFEFLPSDHLNVKFNYSKVSRTPNIAELFTDGLHHSAAIIEIGNMKLKNEDGHQFNLVFDAKANVLNGLNISLNPYLFITKNFINEIPVSVQNTIRGVFPVWNYQQIDARMYGVDLDLNLKINENLEYKGRASYVNGENLTHNESLILMLPPNFSNELEFSRKEWNYFYFNIENQTVLKQNRFPIYNAEIQVFENGGEVTKTIDFSSTPKGYSLWNVQTGIDLMKNFSSGISVSNLFNTKYRDYLNRMRFFSDELGRNIVLTLKFKF